MTRKIEIDMTGVEAWSSTGILQPGDHTCKIVEAVETTSASGLPQLQITLESVSPDSAGDQIRDWISLTPQARGRLKQLLEAAGVEVPDGRMTLDLDDLEGRRVKVLVRHAEYQGQLRSRVKAYEFPQDWVDSAGEKLEEPQPAGGSLDDIPF